MKFSDFKYLAAFIIPFLVYLSISFDYVTSFAAFIFAFVLVPFIEPFFKKSEKNLSYEEKAHKEVDFFFDLLLYLNIPVVFILLYLLADKLSQGTSTPIEVMGYVLSYGTMLGACGINVAHELGHKNSVFSKVSAILLLLPSFYTHFFIEHNRGHHKNVATPEDPATARKNENLYSFWIRSTLGSYRHAWELEFRRLAQRSLPKWHMSNQMLLFSILQLAYSVVLIMVFGLSIFLILAATGVVSFLFLETINYVEHYGLMRKKLSSGRYERVQPWHSWNSNHHLGRIILYELTRHSDHHYLANKKYQLLDHHSSSPQLPFGYPSSMLISMIPPIWFRIMNPRISAYEGHISNQMAS